MLMIPASLVSLARLFSLPQEAGQPRPFGPSRLCLDDVSRSYLDRPASLRLTLLINFLPAFISLLPLVSFCLGYVVSFLLDAQADGSETIRSEVVL